MERFQRENASDYRQSRDSSVYSDDSAFKTSYSEFDYPESTTSTSSRPVPTTPSYMNAIPTRKPIRSRPKSTATDLSTHTDEVLAQQTTTPVSLTKGMLLVAVAELPHPLTISYLETMLKRAAYSSILLLGHEKRETEIKQLKMNVYALLGKLGVEVGVTVNLQSHWAERDIGDAVARGMKSSDVLYGVICSPAFDEDSLAGRNILALDEEEFDAPWRGTVGFLRSVAKASVPKLKPNSKARAASGLFVVTEPAGLSQVGAIYKATCDRILVLLADQNLRLTIAYADTVLIPEPEPVQSNGKLDLTPHNKLEAHDIDDFQAGESPTKLWNMWALQDEMNTI